MLRGLYGSRSDRLSSGLNTMNPRLPIWSQALAIGILSCIFLATYGYVWNLELRAYDHRLQYGIEDTTYKTLHYRIPSLIVYLAARFIGRYVFSSQRTPAWHPLFCWLVVIFVFPAILALLAGAFVPAKQRLRGGGVACLMQSNAAGGAFGDVTGLSNDSESRLAS